MNIETVKKLLMSSLEEDRILGLEHASKMSLKDLKIIFNVSSPQSWNHPINQECIDNTYQGLGWKCVRGYLAYNGWTWYVTSYELFSKNGYKVNR